LQIAVGVAAKVRIGTLLTVTVTIAVFVQPKAEVPVTTYVVVTTGVTTVLLPVIEPGIQV
jgi:hypothetical protein